MARRGVACGVAMELVRVKAPKAGPSSTTATTIATTFVEESEGGYDSAASTIPDQDESDNEDESDPNTLHVGPTDGVVEYLGCASESYLQMQGTTFTE